MSIIHRKGWPRIDAAVFAALFMLGLAACHLDDGSGADSGAPPTQLPRTTVVMSRVALDPALPLPAKQLVAMIVSPLGQSEPGAAIAIPSSGGAGDSLVFALDGQGNVLLAGRTDGAAMTLGADSTALALVRLALGAIPERLDADRLNNDIRAAPAFERLVAAVLASLAIPTVPTTDPTVSSGVADVLVELESVLATRLTEAMASTREAQLATVQFYPSVLTPFPFVLTLGGKDQVEITNSSYLVSNKSLITQSLVSSVAPGEILLEGTAVPDRLLDRYKTATLAGNGGNGFNVTVGQTAESRRLNVLTIGSDVLALLIGETLGQQRSTQCLAAAAKAFLLPKETDPVVRAPSAATLSAYLNNASSIANMRGIIKSCAELSNTAELSVVFAKAFIGVTSGYYEVKAAVNSVGLLFRLVQFKAAVDRGPRTSGVCENSSAGGTVIVNCARTFRLVPEPEMAVGQTLLPNIVAIDIRDAPTVLPAHLRFVSDREDIATIDATGRITARKEGSAAITITDLSTEQFGIGIVRIRSLMVEIAPAAPSLTVGANLQLRATFRDLNGSVVSPPDVVRWTSGDTSVARVDPLSGLVTGVSAGTVVVTAAVSGTESVGRATVTVGTGGDIMCTYQGVDPNPYANGSHLWKIEMRGEVFGNVGDYIFFGGTGSTSFAIMQDMACDGWTYRPRTPDRVAACVRMSGDPPATRWSGTDTQWFNGPLGGPLFGSVGVIGGSPGGQWFLDDPGGDVKQRVVVACPVLQP